MKSRLLASGAERTFILVIDPGEEAFEAIRRFAKAENINAASVTAIGAFATATLAFFDLSTQDYSEIPVTDQSEVLSLLGGHYPGRERCAQSASACGSWFCRRVHKRRTFSEGRGASYSGGGHSRNARRTAAQL